MARYSPRDVELLSAYLDGQVTEAERDEVERRLEVDAALRRLYAELKAVRGLVRSLPDVEPECDLATEITGAIEAIRFVGQAPPAGLKEPSADPMNAAFAGDRVYLQSFTFQGPPQKPVQSQREDEPLAEGRAQSGWSTERVFAEIGRRLANPRVWIWPAAAVAVAILISLFPMEHFERSATVRSPVVYHTPRENRGEDPSPAKAMERGGSDDALPPAPAAPLSPLSGGVAGDRELAAYGEAQAREYPRALEQVEAEAALAQKAPAEGWADRKSLGNLTADGELMGGRRAAAADFVGPPAVTALSGREDRGGELPERSTAESAADLIAPSEIEVRFSGQLEDIWALEQNVHKLVGKFARLSLMETQSTSGGVFGGSHPAGVIASEGETPRRSLVLPDEKLRKRSEETLAQDAAGQVGPMLGLAPGPRAAASRGLPSFAGPERVLIIEGQASDVEGLLKELFALSVGPRLEAVWVTEGTTVPEWLKETLTASGGDVNISIVERSVKPSPPARALAPGMIAGRGAAPGEIGQVLSAQPQASERRGPEAPTAATAEPAPAARQEISRVAPRQVAEGPGPPAPAARGQATPGAQLRDESEKAPPTHRLVIRLRVLP